MSCTCGSQKQSTAPDTINTVNIGALCFLFGIEGALCRVLDLVPATIKAIVSVNPDTGNADDIFRGLLKKVAKTGYGIVVDEATGNIDLTSFCASPSPPLPDDITYYDIYSFIGDLIPILERFFKFNDILQGNSTGLLDKIIKFWLYKQWFEHCECSRCPPPDPNEPVPPSDRPNFTPPNDCDDGSSRCKNLRLRGDLRDPKIISSCYGFWVHSVVLKNLVATPFQSRFVDSRQYYVALEYSAQDFVQDSNIGFLFARDYTRYNDPPRTDVIAATETRTVGSVTVASTYTNDSIQTIMAIQMSISNDGNNFSPFVGNSDGYSYSPCPPPPPPPPPPEFCELFPYDPNCNQQPDECESDNVICGEFIDCNALLRKPVTRSLIKDGDIKEVSVSEFVDCESQRTSKEIDYLECAVVVPPVYGCTDSNASNYNPNANTDDGSCEYLGCTDPNSINYNPYAQTDDGSCRSILYGCTDSNASNYNPDADRDDGSCEYLGCTDPNSINYNPYAQTDDGSCQY